MNLYHHLYLYNLRDSVLEIIIKILEIYKANHNQMDLKRNNWKMDNNQLFNSYMSKQIELCQ